jgi:Thiolase, N-terminal domain
MGQTSENVGNDFNISREDMDRYANESFRRAEVAQKAGWFDDEIVPITTKIKDPKSGERKEVTLTKDEGPRYGTTVESLGKIRPAFPDFGNKTTGGNASQVTDGGRQFCHSDQGTLLIACSCCYSSHETIESYRFGPTYHGKVLRRNRSRRTSPYHGYWPICGHPQTAQPIPSDQR